MARRRVDDEPGLIDRVRWRNVGRLVLLVAVPVLALAPRGCGRREPVLPPEVRVQPPKATPTLVAPPLEKAESRKQKAERRVRPRHRTRSRKRHRHHAPKPPRPATPRPATPIPAPAPSPPPAPEFF